jgi:hypothetical protein
MLYLLEERNTVFSRDGRAKGTERQKGSASSFWLFIRH